MVITPSKSWRADRSAVGGFLEAILAIIIVISAVTLLSISLAMVNSGLRDKAERGTMEAAAEKLAGSFLSLGWPFFADGALRCVSMPLVNSSNLELPNGIDGACILVEDISQGKSPARIFLRGGVPDEHAVRSLAEPVLLSLANGTSYAGKLTVVVW